MSLLFLWITASTPPTLCIHSSIKRHRSRAQTNVPDVKRTPQVNATDVRRNRRETQTTRKRHRCQAHDSFSMDVCSWWICVFHLCISWISVSVLLIGRPEMNTPRNLHIFAWDMHVYVIFSKYPHLWDARCRRHDARRVFFMVLWVCVLNGFVI